MTEPTLPRLLQQARYGLDRTTDVHTGPIDPLQFNTLRRAFDRMLRYLEAREAAMSGPAQVPGEPGRMRMSPITATQVRELVAASARAGDEPVPADDLTELQRLCDAATPGPWALDSEELFVLASGTVFTLETDDDGREARGASLAAARFAIAARDTMPKLIAEVRRLRDKLSRTLPERGIVLAPNEVTEVTRIDGYGVSIANYGPRRVCFTFSTDPEPPPTPPADEADDQEAEHG